MQQIYNFACLYLFNRYTKINNDIWRKIKVIAKTERFQEVLDYLKNEKGITQAKLTETIKNEYCFIDESRITRMKQGKNLITEDVINALEKYYNINPLFLSGVSNIMLKKAGKFIEAFDTIFKKREIVEKHYINEENKEVCDRYLHLTMDSRLYSLLLDIDYVKVLKEKGLDNLAEEKLKKVYDSINIYSDEEYVLIPTNNNVMEIIEHEQDDYFRISKADFEKYCNGDDDEYAVIPMEEMKKFFLTEKEGCVHIPIDDLKKYIVKKNKKYLLIPTDKFKQILDDRIKNKKCLEEVLDLQRYQHYCDD